jgi:hypothetical protein
LNRLDDYPDILKPEDLARLLGFSINSIYKMLDNGEIPGIELPQGGDDFKAEAGGIQCIAVEDGHDDPVTQHASVG